MASTSPNELAHELLKHCLEGTPWASSLLNEIIAAATSADPDRAREATHALFSIVVERLSDLFEPKLCETYAQVFSEVIAQVRPELNGAKLLERYYRIRQPGAFEGDAGAIRTVFVLSRVTLGADVAVTSVILDAARKRFPEADLFFVGPRKGWELFAAVPRLFHLPIPYGRRSTLTERLSTWNSLRWLLTQPASIVIDPDSRLTQLGLLPVCEEENYFFFESRSYGQDGLEPLPALTAQWVRNTFGVEDAKPFIAPFSFLVRGLNPDTTMSLGVGDNSSKRIPDPFEEELVRNVVQRKKKILLDKGGGGEETARIESLVSKMVAGQEALPCLNTWQGSFAPFAHCIAKSNLYVGYDSAGSHVAAACGTPLVTIFAGFVSPRMFARWCPAGSGQRRIVRVENQGPLSVLEETLEALKQIDDFASP